MNLIMPLTLLILNKKNITAELLSGSVAVGRRAIAVPTVTLHGASLRFQEEVALKDAQMCLPKIKRGGYIWFDDVNWTTTRRAWEFLSLHCVKDGNRSTSEYFLFKKAD